MCLKVNVKSCLHLAVFKTIRKKCSSYRDWWIGDGASYEERWDLSLWLLEVHVLPRADLTSHEWRYSFTAQPGE